MDVFCDTSVLVAACVSAHPHHARDRPVLQRILAGADRGFLSTHSIAETYAVLSRLPIQPRIHPLEAARIIQENLLPHFQRVSVTEKDYRAALDIVAAGAGRADAFTMSCCCKAPQAPPPRASTPSTSPISKPWRRKDFGPDSALPDGVLPADG